MSRALHICRRVQLQKCSQTSLCQQNIPRKQIQICRKLSSKQTFTKLRVPIIVQCTDQRSVLTTSGLGEVRHRCARHFSVTGQKLWSMENCDIQGSSDEVSDDVWQQPLEMPEPDIDWEYICEQNREDIAADIVNRKGVGDINQVLLLKSEFDATGNEETRLELLKAASEIPNRSSPHSPIGDESNARLVGTFGEKTEFKDFKPQKTSKLGEDLNLLRINNLGITTGTRSYYFMAELADLEHALIQLAITKLVSRGFQLVTVPEIINPAVIEACGFHTKGEVTQVYTLDEKFHGEQCLIGTAEMPLAAFFLNEFLEEEELPRRNPHDTALTFVSHGLEQMENLVLLNSIWRFPPIRMVVSCSTWLCSVSRCYRAEAAGGEEKEGIYRVHQFTKVEMFGVTGSLTEADNLLLEYVDIEKEMFSELGLHFRILEMPTHELGAPAYRKFDIEAWIPAFGLWGEISSASNCTDYQSRRLNIKYRTRSGVNQYVHTVNGTACAVPRMVMAILENFQNKDGSINIPEVLQPFMGNKKVLTKSDAMPTIQWIKHAKVNWES